MGESFTDFAATYCPLINARLQVLLTPKTATTPHGILLADVQLLVGRGGKRLRPLLCLLVYEGYGGTNPARLVPVAAALELLHTYLLIHDDIIDRDFERWHGPNISGVYFERYSQRMDSQKALHFAESQAILAGDICHTMALQSIVDSRLPSALRLQVLSLVNTALEEVLAGETNDVTYSHQAVVPSVNDVLTMYRQKTASYSFALPFLVGALLAGASSQEADLLQAIANDLGVAYQLQDDMLSKSAHSDVREAKRTVLFLVTLKRATAAQRRILTTSTDVETVQGIMTTCGARDYVTGLIETYTKRAIKNVHRTHLNKIAKTRLIELFEQLVNRQA